MIPAVEVRAGGQQLPGGGRVRAVRVARRLSQPAQCELTLHDPQGRAVELLGAAITVRVGGDERDLFAGDVTGVDVVRAADGETVSRVVAYDALHRLRKRQTPRCLEHVDAVELAEAVAAGLGVTVEADEPGPRFERVLQHRQRDLELLAATLARVGLYAVLDDRRLRLVSLRGHGEPVVLRYGRNLHRAEISASLERAAARCAATAWRPRTADLLTAAAERPAGGRDIALRPQVGTAGGAGTLTLLDAAAAGEDELRAVAQAALDVSDARTVVFDGVAAGRPDLRAGARVRIEGVAAALDGAYVLSEVVTTVDADGYLATLSSRPPERAAERGGAALTLGTVADVADPDGCGRVRVTLGAVAGLDLGWLPVLAPGAGAGRGLVVLPDVGDAVLVALPQDAHGAAIVLGSLFGAAAAPDGAGVSGGRVRRWSLRTAAGQSVVVDDEHKSLRLQNDAGSYVELGPDLLRLHAATDLVLEAPGHGITVKASSVDFEHSIVDIAGGLT
ncbi:phage baseplate assembly protein V [Dactylosporangium matsuzakiense]|uniref:phage baseplate assembly protein V n=1 Tax=Dactylosporangium matsuzakiense TaxID=53360 RepID=UPI0021C35102|nr:phage baseplate assembly protein V [Dactylosporangium matsuzakiense]UWZ41012.1 type IV secretion protein Rhs [Dactylosporangium matsuzakiense]